MSSNSVHEGFEPFVSGSPGEDACGILKSWLNLSRGCPAWPQFEDRHVILTHLGRVAIALLCEVWRLQEGDEVLAPAYNCGSEIDPWLWCGLRVVPYRISTNTEIDLKDLERRVNKRTRVIYVTHFFGWPQPMREIIALCRGRGVFCVEDCALSLFSKGQDDWLGRMGDATIYSFPKSLGVPDGGALVLRTAEAVSGIRLDRPAFSVVLRRALSLIKNHSTRTTNPCLTWLRSSGKTDRSMEDRLIVTEGRPEMRKSYYFDKVNSRWAMSTVARRLLTSCHWEKVVKRRRANYIQLHGALRDCPAIKPLFSDLPEGVCPLCLPVLVSDRDKWFHHLHSVGIMAYRWWRGYHPGLPWKEYPEACALKDRILSLPIHQDLDEDQVEYIGEQVKRFGARVWSSRSSEVG